MREVERALTQELNYDLPPGYVLSVASSFSVATSVMMQAHCAPQVICKHERSLHYCSNPET